MQVDILLTIAATSVVQSIFGAGVLLFGTPILLLLGYPFIDVLVVLLPISITINLLQIAKHHTHIDLDFYGNVLWLTLPAIAVFLFLVTHSSVNIGLIVGGFLLLIAVKEYSPAVTRGVDALMQYKTGYFIGMGVIHGISNLGGSLLTALVHNKGYEKDVARVTVAVSYATFAVVQVLTLLLFSSQRVQGPYWDTGVYLVTGALIFMLTDEMLYANLDRDKYTRIFAGFLAASGVVLILKSLS